MELIEVKNCEKEVRQETEEYTKESGKITTERGIKELRICEILVDNGYVVTVSGIGHSSMLIEYRKKEVEMDDIEEFKRKEDGHMFLRYNKEPVLYSETDYMGTSDIYHFTEEQLKNDYIKIREFKEEA